MHEQNMTFRFLGKTHYKTPILGHKKDRMETRDHETIKLNFSLKTLS